MRKYKCPECGKITTSMYCDTCQKSIPSQCAIDNIENMDSESASVASTAELQDIKKYTQENNYLLSQIERHTKVMAVIMVISMICAAVSAASALIMFINLSRLF